MKNSKIAQDILKTGESFYERILGPSFFYKVKFYWEEVDVDGDVDDFTSSEEFASDDIDEAWSRAEELRDFVQAELQDGEGLLHPAKNSRYKIGSLKILDVDFQGS